MIEVGVAPRAVNVDADVPLLRLFNLGPALCFVRVGTGETTASADGDFPVPARQAVTLNKGIGADRLAAVSITVGPTRLYVTPGTEA